MAGYSFKDASGTTRQAAASSLLSGLGPQVNLTDSTGANTANVTAAGALATTFSGSPSISGAVTVVGTPSISGAVTVVGNPSISGTINIGIIPGSVVAFPQPASISGLGIFNTNNIGNGSIITVPSGSVITVGQGSVAVAIVSGSVATTFSPGSVSGVGLFNVNHVGNGSVLTQMQGSVVTVFQNSSLISVWKDSSILSVPVGSTITVLQAASIVGTYAEDAASASGDKGIFVMGVRNDTLSSVTSADGDYSSHVVGPAGEMIVAPAPMTKWISAQTSVMYGTSVQAIAAQGASVFTYIAGLQIANDSGTFSRVKITGGLGSVLAWTVAPANGGSNIVFVPPIKTGENSGVSASINGVSSVYVTMQGFISKT